MDPQIDKNIQVLLARRPKGAPTEADFRIIETPVPTPEPGNVLVQNLYLSLDPYMRGRMNDVKSYIPPIEIDAVMGGGTVGRIVQSDVSHLPEGTVGGRPFGLASVRDGKAKGTEGSWTPL